MLRRLTEEADTSVYEDYYLSPYQHKMLMHLLWEENPMYIVIPDWQNLFIITLLYAQMKTAKYKKVVVYSKWPLEDVMDVLRDVPDFYELYEEVIQHSVRLVFAEYSRLKEEPENDYSIGMGTSNKLKYGGDFNENRRYVEKTFEPNLVLGLKGDIGGFSKIYPAYVKEQIHPVWVITDYQRYKMTEKPLYVSKPIGKKTLLEYNYFVIDSSEENVYALYSLLARSGDGQKMMKNYFSYPTDYGSGSGQNPGNYLLPFKFYLELPAWLPLKGTISAKLGKGLTYLELILLTHEIDLPKKDSKLIVDNVRKTCGKFDLELHYQYHTYRVPGKSQIIYWALMDPTAELCDTLVVSDNLKRISAEEEERLRLAELEKEERDRLETIKRRLQRSVYEPLSKAGYTVKEMKLLAVERNIDVKGLIKKADIAKRILEKS